jgi:hypothetical protein
MGYHRLGILPRLEAIVVWLWYRREIWRLDRANRAAARQVTR